MYLDSGILVKLLTPEPDSAKYSSDCAGHVLYSSELALTEVLSALLAKERCGVISTELREQAEARFHSWITVGSIVLVPLNRTAVSKASALLRQTHPAIPLRTSDAIHLGTVDLCQRFPLVTTDERMRQAALVLGFPLASA